MTFLTPKNLCRICGDAKPLDEFYKDASKKDGRRTECKVCTCNKMRQHYQGNKEAVNDRNREYQRRNKDKCRVLTRAWRSMDGPKQQELKKKQPVYGLVCRNRKKDSGICTLCPNPARPNRVHCQECANKRNKYAIRKRRTDLYQRLKDNLRARLNMAVRGNIKSGSAVRDLGCSVEYFKAYIEDQFQEGMNWDNHGDWHLDHIKPLSAFDLSDRSQTLEACHYTNYQPLWAADNLRKGSKLLV